MTANNRLKQAREEKGMTQRSLALEVSVEEQTVRKWESGTRTPRLEAQARLCAILEKTPEELGFPPKERHSLQEASPVEVLLQQTRPLEGQGAGENARISSPLPKKRDDNRQRMIQRVRSRWITGILDYALDHAPPITLRLQKQPDAVENPWRLTVQESNLPSQTLPPGTSIINLYDEASGALLILGEPGIGKTTLLLELARTLLVQAEEDESRPLPVVFNLSSWAEKRQPLADWLTEELNSKYQIPRPLARSWVTNEHILPLLDGLDEVVETQRTACIAMINKYREAHGMLPMVVCCRTTDYLAQPLRLLLHGAVIVQPLTAQQIDTYVSHAGKELVAMRTALQQDDLLREMASTSLMLHILSVAYEGISVADVLALDTFQQRRQLVLKTYVERALQRRRTTPYPLQQTVHYLTWLASQMKQRSQTEFYLERIQPDWHSENARYRHMILRLIYGVQLLITPALYSWLRGGSRGGEVGVSVGLLGALGSGPGNRVLEWMAPGIGGGVEGGGSLGIILTLVFGLVTLLISRIPLPALSWTMLRYGLSRGLHIGGIVGGIVGAFACVLFCLKGGISDGLYRGLGAGLFCLLLTGLTVGLMAGLNYEPISQHEQAKVIVQQHGHKLRRIANHLLDMLIFWGCGGFGFGIVDVMLAGGVNKNVIIYGLIAGLYLGIVFGIGGGTNLIRGLGTEIKPAELVAWSWSTIGRDLAAIVKKALLVGLCVMVCVVVAIACASTLFYGLAYGLRYGAVYGVIIGLVGGIAGILTGVLTDGWSSMKIDERQLTRPNEGIRRSARHALFAASIFGLIGGIASGLISGLAFGIVGGIAGWPILMVGFTIVFGILFALQFGVVHGGAAVIEHYVLRWYLWRSGVIPWDAVSFLDDAAEHILLRKIGGGYMFAHRLLMDYFASLDQHAAISGKVDTLQ